MFIAISCPVNVELSHYFFFFFNKPFYQNFDYYSSFFQNFRIFFRGLSSVHAANLGPQINKQCCRIEISKKPSNFGHNLETSISTISTNVYQNTPNFMYKEHSLTIYNYQRNMDRYLHAISLFHSWREMTVKVQAI